MKKNKTNSRKKIVSLTPKEREKLKLEEVNLQRELHKIIKNEESGSNSEEFSKVQEKLHKIQIKLYLNR